MVGFVRAVHVEIEFAGVIEVQHRNVLILHSFRRYLGARDRPLDLTLDGCQKIDEVIHGGAGADAYDATVYILQGCLCGELFPNNMGLIS